MAQVLIFGKATNTNGKHYPVGARVPHGLFTASKSQILQNQRWIVPVDENEIDEYPEPQEVAYKPSVRLLTYLEAGARYDEAKDDFEAAKEAVILAIGGLSETEQVSAVKLDPRHDARTAEVMVEEAASVELSETLAAGAFAAVAGETEG